jgi:hypothetical protein
MHILGMFDVLMLYIVQICAREPFGQVAAMYCIMYPEKRPSYRFTSACQVYWWALVAPRLCARLCCDL